jgi:hypothetical protein
VIVSFSIVVDDVMVIDDVHGDFPESCNDRAMQADKYGVEAIMTW